MCFVKVSIFFWFQVRSGTWIMKVWYFHPSGLFYNPWKVYILDLNDLLRCLYATYLRLKLTVSGTPSSNRWKKYSLKVLLLSINVIGREVNRILLNVIQREVNSIGLGSTRWNSPPLISPQPFRTDVVHFWSSEKSIQNPTINYFKLVFNVLNIIFWTCSKTYFLVHII